MCPCVATGENNQTFMENDICSGVHFGNGTPPQTSPAAWAHLAVQGGGGCRRRGHPGRGGSSVGAPDGLEARPHLMSSSILSLISSIRFFSDLLFGRFVYGWRRN